MNGEFIKGILYPTGPFRLEEKGINQGQDLRRAYSGFWKGRHAKRHILAERRCSKGHVIPPVLGPVTSREAPPPQREASGHDGCIKIH